MWTYLLDRAARLTALSLIAAALRGNLRRLSIEGFGNQYAFVFYRERKNLFSGVDCVNAFAVLLKSNNQGTSKI